MIIIGQVKSSPYFYSKKYLKHFITEFIEVELKVKAKLKVAILIPPTLEALSSLGLSGLDCHQRGFGEIFLSYRPRQEAKAWPGLPALASPTLGPVHQSSQQKTFPHSKRKMVHRREPQAAVGHRVGGIIIETFSFACNLRSISNELHDEVLEIFFAGDTKENCKSLKPQSVHYRNQAWINNIGVLSF